MKKQKLIAVVLMLSIFLTMLPTMSFAATKPAAPTGLTWEGTVAKWGPVANADGYHVYLYKDGSEDYVTFNMPKTNEYDFGKAIATSKYFGPGSYTFKVKVSLKSDVWNYSDLSVESGVYTYSPVKNLSTSTNLLWKGKVARWEAVEGAADYVVSTFYSDTNERHSIFVTTSNQYDFTEEIDTRNLKSTIYFKVIARKVAGTYDAGVSEWSAESEAFTGLQKLDNPTNVYWDKGVARWDAVPGAESYYVDLYKSDGTIICTSSGVPYNYYGMRRLLDFYGATKNEDYYFTVRAAKRGHIISDKVTSSSPMYQYIDCSHSFAEIQVDFAKRFSDSCSGDDTYYKSCTLCNGLSEEYFTIPNTQKEHIPTYVDNMDGATHRKKCSVCGTELVAGGNHIYDKEVVNDNYLKSSATCSGKAVYYKSCACGANSMGTSGEGIFEGGEKLQHTFGTTWDGKDATGHWHCCSICQEKSIVEKHTPNIASATEQEAKICTECGYIMEAVLGHQCKNHVTKVPGKAATCTEEGNKIYYICDCNKWYEDVVCLSEITDKTSVKVPKLVHSWDEGKITTPATAAKEGAKTFTCTHCKATRVEPIAKLLPVIIEGKDSQWEKESEKVLSFRSDADFKDFINVTLDGKSVDSKNYTLKSGSIIVELKPEYLSTLAPGNHTLAINSTSGKAETTFTIAQASTENNKGTEATTPQTGDNSNLLLWSVLLLISFGGIVYGKKRREVK